MNKMAPASDPTALKIKELLLWLAVSCLAVNTGQILFAAKCEHTLPDNTVNLALLALFAVALIQMSFNWRTYIKAATSINFGVATVVLTIIATMLGTLIVQTNNQTVFFAHYGLAAPVMTWLYLNDLFHSAWFAFLLGLIGLGLAGIAVRRKAWRWRQIGFLLSHGGIILVLIGGAVGQICGQRGVISLETGEAAGKFDESNGRTASLPFQLRLKNFVVDKRRPEFRLYVISKHNDENKIVASFDASKPAIHDLPGGGQVEVRAFTSGERPNIADSNNAGVAGSSVLSDPSDPSVRLSLRSRDNAGSEVILKGSGPASISLGNEERELRFAKKSDDIANFVSTLGIETNGNQVFSREVRVNQPLNYGGYSFYQASYDPKNPRYSGLLVVRDPGLGFVYVGIIAVLFGIMHILLVRPRREPKEVEVA